MSAAILSAPGLKLFVFAITKPPVPSDKSRSTPSTLARSDDSAVSLILTCSLLTAPAPRLSIERRLAVPASSRAARAPALHRALAGLPGLVERVAGGGHLLVGRQAPRVDRVDAHVGAIGFRDHGAEHRVEVRRNVEALGEVEQRLAAG